jgi:hypothetical protein
MREFAFTLASQISEQGNCPDLKSVITAEPKTTRIVLDLKD